LSKKAFDIEGLYNSTTGRIAFIKNPCKKCIPFIDSFQGYVLKDGLIEGIVTQLFPEMTKAFKFPTSTPFKLYSMRHIKKHVVI
jgi:hypothetical protein